MPGAEKCVVARLGKERPCFFLTVNDGVTKPINKNMDGWNDVFVFFEFGELQKF